MRAAERRPRLPADLLGRLSRPQRQPPHHGLRIFTIIPIAILAATIEGGSFGAQAGGEGVRYAGGGIGCGASRKLQPSLGRAARERN
jgi:hypothetical protein